MTYHEEARRLPPMLDPALPRWGFVFLACPAFLSEGQRLDLVRMAYQSYLDDVGHVRFDWEGCCGELQASSDTVVLGSFIGQRFTARVDAHQGSGTVEFLVAEGQLRSLRGPVAEA